MTSSSRPSVSHSTHRARTDMKFLIDATPPIQPRIIREDDRISRSYPSNSSVSTLVMGEPPSPQLYPERPPRSMTPDNWTLSSPNSDMPSPLRNSLAPMLNLAREAIEEAYPDQTAREVRPSSDVSSSQAATEEPSRRNSSRPRSSQPSPPSSRSQQQQQQQQQGYHRYRSPRVETDSEPEEGTSSRPSWHMPTFERVVPEPPRTPPPPPAPSTYAYSGPWTSPRRTKSKVKRTGTNVAQRRVMDTYALSSDSGIAGSPLCQSPLIALPLPDIPPSASEAERGFFPPERPVRSQQRPSRSETPSPSQSPLALQPVSPCDEGYRTRPVSPVMSNRSVGERRSPVGMTVLAPLSPGSTLAAQTRPPSPALGAPASPRATSKQHGKQMERTPSPLEEPAVHHSEFYMQDEMVILRVENTLFRVHRYFLERDSTFFKDFFQRTLVHGAGKTDDSAIRLPDVSRREFECLLHFLYHGASSTLFDSILNLVLLLSTASALSFPAARIHAITALDAASPPLDPVERVFLAEKYSIPAWRRPAYVALCARAHPLEDTEAEVLGLQTTARLARAREAVLEEKVQEWRRAVERAESGQGGVSKEDMEVREARLVERVVDDVFALSAER